MTNAFTLFLKKLDYLNIPSMDDILYISKKFLPKLDYLNSPSMNGILYISKKFLTKIMLAAISALTQIAQNVKAKVPLGVPAVGQTFKIIQSDNKPVTIPNHGFPRGTLSSTYIADILSLSENPNLDQTLKIENEFKLILVLLVDEQSAYNSVERSMSTFLKKLEGIILPVNHFVSHLNTMVNIIDSNLELYNFHYATGLINTVYYVTILLIYKDVIMLDAVL
ncbi:887_t:CDS:2, partial [Gigaspora margarita]